MEHIPWTGPHALSVPYLGGEWDGEDFLTYPNRCGYDWNDTFSPDPDVAQPSRALQSAQTWLFFGLYAEVFQLHSAKFDPADFRVYNSANARNGTYPYLLNTKNLFPHLLRLGKAAIELREGKRERLQILFSWFSVASNAFDALRLAVSHWASQINPDILEPFSGAVFLSLKLCSEALKDVCIVIYRGNGEDILLPPSLGFATRPGSAWLVQRMKDQGWCPNVINRLGIYGREELQYYAFTHAPPARHRGQHGSCSELVCTLNQINEQTYETKHFGGPGCSCKMQHAHDEDVEEIVRHGHIPVLRVTTTTDESGNKVTRLELNNAAPDRPFVALSHVWSHGLGNPKENALPLCSLLRIQLAVETSHNRSPKMTVESEMQGLDFLADSHWFWMDTMCIPVRPEAISLRKLAIKQMKDIYSMACHALVVDTDLQSQPLPPNNIDIVLKIAVSDWFGRLWTLQESALAQKVLVLTSRSCIQLDELFSRLNDIYDTELFHGTLLLHKFHAIVKSLRAKPENIESISSFRNAITSAVGRSTSKASDETVCLATLLNLDVQRLFDADQELSASRSDDEICDSRMVCLLEQVGKVPVSYVFSEGQRVRLSGFKWAIRSVSKSTVYTYAKENAKIEHDGVHFERNGYLLKDALAAPKNFMFRHRDSDVLCFVREDDAGKSDSLQEPSGRELALIVLENLDRFQESPAILVSSLSASEGTRDCRYLSAATVKRPPSDSNFVMDQIRSQLPCLPIEVLGPQTGWKLM